MLCSGDLIILLREVDMMKKIKDIFECDYDIEISGITDDSRNVQEGFLFVATKGFNVDHYDYISDAIERGCSFVVCDREILFDIPHLIVSNINDFFVDCCLQYYDIALGDFNFVGITGTDGKTTTATIVQKLLDDAAYIGTNGLAIGDFHLSTNNTTPCIGELYDDLNKIKEKNGSKVVMEVSSEALLHERVKNFKFDIVGFTNITGDHLNVHKTFDNYVNCKLKLLDLVKENGYVVVNGDDVNLQKIKVNNLSTFGFKESNDYVICHVKHLSNYTEITVKNGKQVYEIYSPFVGEYNVYNVVMAFVIGLKAGEPASLLIKKIRNLKAVHGRCEFLNFGQDYQIVLDYAHTINGVKNILETFKDSNRVITVTGAAGGREHEKRNTIGNLVMDYSDITIFTMDDPRYEDVDKIIDEMVGDRKDYIRIVNREEAIHYALNIATSGDVVLILGKGRDNYMAIQDKKVKYNDYDVVKNYFLDE